MGLGIMVPGAEEFGATGVNQQGQQQLSSHFLYLPGEKLKKQIGYDLDGDGAPDTDLWRQGVLQNTVFMGSNPAGGRNDRPIQDGVVTDPRMGKALGHGGVYGYHSEDVINWYA
jgi:hypothetical protein